MDFLLPSGTKLTALEVKSSGTGKHESLLEFQKKYSVSIRSCVILSQKDIRAEERLRFLPFYFAGFLMEAPRE